MAVESLESVESVNRVSGIIRVSRINSKPIESGESVGLVESTNT